MVGLTRATKLAVVAALTLLAGYGVWSAAGDAASALAQEPVPERHELHEQMHEMMGEGASGRMHEAIPGSDEMLERCSAMMAMMQAMMGEGMDRMMGDGMGGMMNR